MNGVILPFSVYTIVLLLDEIASVGGHNCKVSTLDGKMFVDCSGLSNNTNILTVPDDIDTNVQYLDLSQNIYKEMKESSLQKYGNLTRLTIRNAKVNALVDNYLFRPLTKLEDLDISGIRFEGSSPIFYWPTNIKKLNISNSNYKDLNAADLINLEILNASNNDMESFPYLNKHAPIYTINLDGNTLNGLKVEHMSPYCHIKELSMKVSEESDLLSPPKYCDCLRLNIWMKQFDIIANILECNQATNANETCNKEFGEDELSKRRECLGTNSRQSYTFLFIFVIVLILLLTLLTLLFAYRYVNLRRHVRPTKSPDGSINESESVGEDDGISE